MGASTAGFLSNRVLKINVGFLLSDGPGNSKNIQLNITDRVRVSEDLIVESVIGMLRLTRTAEGILLQTHNLTVVVERECSRCLDVFEQSISLEIQELYASPRPIDDTEFYIAQDAQLDLSPLLRAEILIVLTQRQYCRSDCQGLCVYCGANHNHTTCTCAQDQIDPRMAQLKELLDAAE